MGAVKDPSTRAGRFIRAAGPEKVDVFHPALLPPDPPIRMDVAMQDANDRALVALGRLDAVTTLLPNPNLFLYMYIRKEAVLSSQIEGTQSTLSDLLIHEIAGAPGVPAADVVEVSNYVAAMDRGIAMLRKFPLNLRLVRAMHETLVRNARGSDKTPGELRTSQNWIGGTRPGTAVYVPPPPHELGELLGNLEKFLNDEPVRTPTLVKAGIAHAQFETIHPFLDGNGRVGRLLITLALVAEGVLAKPLLYLSLHFKKHRSRYYELLQRIRTHGEWEPWLHFYLDGVSAVSTSAVVTVEKINELFDRHRRSIAKVGKGSGSALAVFEHLQQRAVVTIPEATKALGLTVPTVSAAIKRLLALKIVGELRSGNRRHFLYREYIELLDRE